MAFLRGRVAFGCRREYWLRHAFIIEVCRVYFGRGLGGQDFDGGR